MHWLLLYDTAPAYLERRPAFRSKHLDLAVQAHVRGDLVLAGALADPVDGAVLVFRSEAAARAFAEADPYVANGLVERWRVRAWATVIGDGAALPELPPA